MKIGIRKLDKCDDGIRNFIERCQKLYHDTFMTSNIHSAIHLAKSVKMSGPLWASSAFLPESQIGKIKSGLSGTNRIAQQVADRASEYFIHRNQILHDVIDNNDIASTFCKSLLFKRPKPTFNYELVEDVMIYKDGVTTEGRSSRCHDKGTIYHSKEYKKAKTVDNTDIIYDGNRIGQIDNFFVEKGKLYVHIDKLFTTPYKKGRIILENIFIMKRREKNLNISITSVLNKVIYINIQTDSEYIVISPPFFDVQ